jgi:hypothetical protein
MSAGGAMTAPLRLEFILRAGFKPAPTNVKDNQAVNNMLKHNVLMNIRQQTFNSYMWSR